MILQDNSAERNRGITLASIKGIIGNVVLVIFKMIIGLASNSIAIILDAVNNLTDVLSSVLTIVGTKLAAKGADKEHPIWTWPYRIYDQPWLLLSHSRCRHWIP